MIILALQNSRQPMTILTRFRQYKNMLIVSMSVPDDYTTMNALKAVLTCREIIIVGTANVAVAAAASSQPQKSGGTNGGTRQVMPVNHSHDKRGVSMFAV